MVMDLLKEIEKMIKVTTYKNKALMLLNIVLLRKYPQVEDSKMITMEEIIDWDLWPNIFSILGKHFVYPCKVMFYAFIVIVMTVAGKKVHICVVFCFVAQKRNGFTMNSKPGKTETLIFCFRSVCLFLSYYQY